MIFDVTLGGHTELWSFRDSARLAVWLGTQPWVEKGGICLVQTTPGRGYDSTLEALVKAAHSSNSNRASLRIVTVQAPLSSLPPLETLSQCIGQIRGNQYDNLRVFGGALRDPHLFMVPNAGHYGIDWWGRLRLLCDSTAKIVASGPLAVIALDHECSLSFDPTFDFRNGGPVGHVLSHATEATIVMWQAYLHHRIAWEVAGSLELAHQLDARINGLSVGDDNNLERQLNGFSDDLAIVHKVEFEQLARILGASTRSNLAVRLQSGFSEDIRALELAGLLWPSNGRRALNITPWAARALARSPHGTTHKWQIRSALVCMPLAGELLKTCFELESRIRFAALSRGVLNESNDETFANFNRFVSGKDNTTAYPSEHPLIPRDRSDVWAFASLGEILKAATFTTPEAFWQTLHLRNTVAHGHYVCWHHVNKAVQLMRSIF